MGGWELGKNAEESLESMEKYILSSLSPSTSKALRSFFDTWTAPQLCTLAGGSIISFFIGVKVGGMRSFFTRRITSLQDLQSNQFGPNAAPLRGRVTAVSDGDTFRFYHVPTIFHSSVVKEKKDALPIRICTIDTPEIAKFGNPGQEYGPEAKDKLSSLILDRTVKVQLLQRDQYGRAVAHVSRKGWFSNVYCDEEMLKAGLAEVYTGSGAVYGHKGKDYYLGLQEKAERKKRGMWKLGDKRETAAEYKARIKRS